MTLALFALQRYLVVLLFCTVAYVIGAAVLRKLVFANLSERVAICTSFGLGILSHLVLLVGVMGWLDSTGLLVGIGLAFVASALVLHRNGLERAQKLSRRKCIVAFLALAVPCLILYPAFALPLYPPTFPDVTSFHLAAPKIWLNAHAIIATPFLRGPVLPHSAHTLFAAMMLIQDDLAAQALSLVAIVLIALALFGWAQQVKGTPTGYLAAALWLGSPAVLIMSGMASYHMISSLFCVGFIYSTANFARTRQGGWLFAAAAFCGFAQSTWSMTAYFLPVAAAAFACFLYQERKLSLLLVVMLGFLVGWGPALARALYYTGNPFFPLLTEVFGPGPWWTEQDVAELMHDIRRFGLPRSVSNFLALPYALAVAPANFQATVSYSIALFLMTPFVILRGIFDRYVCALGIVLLSYLVCWFMLGQIMRYLLPVIPIACLITALTATWFIDWLARSRPNVAKAFVTVAALALLIPGAFCLHETVHRLGEVPTTPAQRTAFLTTQLADYPDIAAANLAPAPLYALFGETYAYFSDGPFMGDWFGPGRYAQILGSLGSGKELHDALRRLGAQYFFVTWREGTPLLPYDDYFAQHFEVVRADLGSELYRLHDTPIAGAAPTRNLLRNPDFDYVTGSWPDAWDHSGSPKTGIPNEGTAPGGTAVRVDESNFLSQRVRIEPGAAYRLALQASADKPKATFRLQVNWSDHKGAICGVFIRVCEAASAWQTFAGHLVAPPAAETATIYANGQTAEPVWLDSFHFEKVSGQPDQPGTAEKANR
jgi:hypothetical protein